MIEKLKRRKRQQNPPYIFTIEKSNRLQYDIIIQKEADEDNEGEDSANSFSEDSIENILDYEDVIRQQL